MEIKKNKNADLENERLTRWLMALVFVLSSVLVALEYNSGNGDGDDIDDDMLEDVARDVELAPVSQQQPNRIALAPEKKQEATPQKIRVVEDNAEVQPPETDKSEGDQKGDTDDSQQSRTDADTDFAPAQADLGDNPLHFRVVEDLPKFPGGAVELMKWLTKNLRYPHDAQKAKKEGKVVVQFIINRDGTLSDLKVVRSSQYASLDREALRVMRMMPRWTPGTHDNKPCRTMVCVPIVFKL